MMKHFLNEMKTRVWDLVFGILFIIISYLLVYWAYGFTTDYKSFPLILGMIILWNSAYELGRREGRRDVQPEEKRYEN